jgi:hypothetical protein
VTIKEALEQLRVVIPAEDRTVFISLEVRDYHHYSADDPTRTHICFRIWDERQFYEGHSLEIAVQKCLLGNVPDQAKPDEAETAAIEAQTMQTATA